MDQVCVYICVIIILACYFPSIEHMIYMMCDWKIWSKREKHQKVKMREKVKYGREGNIK